MDGQSSVRGVRWLRISVAQALPKSPDSLTTSARLGRETKKPRFLAENEAFSSDAERRRWELNPRVTDLQSVALATWLRRLIEGRNLVVSEKWVKVATDSLEGWRRVTRR